MERWTKLTGKQPILEGTGQTLEAVKSKRGRAIVVLVLDEDLTNDQVAEVAEAVEADFARLIRLV